MTVENARKKEEDETLSSEDMSQDEDYNPESDAETTDSESEEDKTESSSGSEDDSEVKRQINVYKRKLKAKKGNEVVKKQKVESKVEERKKSAKKSEKKQKKSTPKPSTSTAGVKEKKPKETKEQKQDDDDDRKEGQFDPSSLENEGEKTDKTGRKREVPLFNDKNLDYNLFNNDPENVVPKKIKISNTVLVTCKMIDSITGGGAGGLSYDYAALTFLRKIQNQKAFEFNLPLSLAPNIIEALKLIMKDNPKFFKKHCTTNISVE